MTENTSTIDTANRHLKRALNLTRLGMACERILRSFWPLWSLVFIAIAALFIGLQDIMPLEWVRGASGLMLIAMAAAAVHGLRRFRWPSLSEAQQRLDATLPGRPLAALADEQAIGATDPASRAVWQAHIARMARAAHDAKAARPDLRLSSRDPYALRYVAVLALAVALVFGSVGRMASISELGPGMGRASIAGPSWEGWIEPPIYTGLPSLYLNDLVGRDVDAATGSRVTIRLYGEAGALSVAETVSGEEQAEGTESPTPQTEASFVVSRDGEITISGGADDARWRIRNMPDAAPSVSVTGSVDVSAEGVMRQRFRATDDYGVVAGRATFSLDDEELDRRYGLATQPDPRDDLVIDLPITITGDRSDFSEVLTDNLSKHPWAGLPVEMTLFVEDEAGQAASSEPKTLPMPGRSFFDPMARAVIEMRRDLLWARSNAPRVAQVLRAITHRPEETFESAAPYLMLRTAMRRLEAEIETGLDAEAQERLAEALWEVAVRIEDGGLSDALARLRRAQERLRQAMREGATDEEIQQLMDELREATREYLRQLAQNPEDGSEMPSGPSQQLSQQDIQDLMDRIQELMEQGRMAEAEALMQQFQQMMENMQVTRQSGQGGQGEGEQAMDGLSETLREQQGLSDDAFRNLQEQGNPGAQAGQSGENEGRSGGAGRGQSHDGTGEQGRSDRADGESGDGATPDSLADRQRALRNELSRQRGNLPGEGTADGEAAREALDRAGRAMDDAEDALRDNDIAGALDNQAEAMEELREGMRRLSDAMSRNGRDRATAGQDGRQADGRDPLGRETGGQGALGTDQEFLQDGEVARRAEELLNELRERSSDQQRPKRELDYLKRLLDRF